MVKVGNYFNFVFFFGEFFTLKSSQLSFREISENYFCEIRPLIVIRIVKLNGEEVSWDEDQKIQNCIIWTTPPPPRPTSAPTSPTTTTTTTTTTSTVTTSTI